MDEIKSAVNVHNWQEFRRITSNDCTLLKELDKFPNAILVTGCQRSGTTMLSRIITESDGMVKYSFGRDDELDAALILSGLEEHQPQGRYCFQTTYLDDCYSEYLDHDRLFKIIWVLRNPFSVVYSLMYNWRQEALEGTFRRCGVQLLEKSQKWKYQFFGASAISRVMQASLLYTYKVSQFLELNARLGPENIMAVDYDDLVLNSEKSLQEIYRFTDLGYQPVYSRQIHRNSLQKSNRLTKKEISTIRSMSEPIYLEARRLVNTP